MERNELYPVFLKVSNLNILIVGGGNVALEKLTFLLKSSPNAQVEMVSPMFREETIALANKFGITMHLNEYNETFLKGKHMVVATTDIVKVNEQVYHDCRAQSILVNVADNPPFCDFYMGGIVTKGNVKVAISTNGKSPTTAKRLRQFFEDVIPDNIDDLVKNLNEFRKTIKGDFEEKVETLNEFTKGLVNKKDED
ncbi:MULTISPECIES: precorrin-2 dehydrogenase/sirohydrochlorin ferrochelatase family protein [Zobellia]|uniref:precorrin-2 dehydrogenase n=1 Tax=Zobellia barbeyronii TaxID=2748009 RepID=A0ABS5WBP0_9FLAO|nr:MULTISPECIES: bifunctional precorrin-2 dehydrogenase/sirohydrochlorin ferrochelatase [Zobellia]MBT2160240.1 bifunctional precorrin-2 dehydrogenase/sirohydrochlorin ferrochelatase [Zobellia barbeyronii]WKX77899.1 bifunctional precorrin-2 dehydrogenase/sirohydrochlorin ferrochelatase [Zobellia laminariae]